MAGPMAKPLGPMAAQQPLGPMAAPQPLGGVGSFKGHHFGAHHSLHEIRNGAWRKRLPIHSIW